MRKITLFLLILTACKSHERKVEEKMNAALSKYLNDIAFKANAKATIMEMKFISIDTLNNNWLDTLRLLENIERHHRFSQEADKLEVEMKGNISSMKLYGAAQMKPLVEHEHEKFKESGEKLNAIIDSLAAIEKEDSIIKENISKNITPLPIYRGKYFMKMSFEKDGRFQNHLDTLLYLFNSDLTAVLYGGK